MVYKIWRGIPETLPAKQAFWNRPGVLEDKARVEASLSSAHHQASFLAASTQHSGDWLFALPIASCGLKLDDEARTEYRTRNCLAIHNFKTPSGTPTEGKKIKII